MRKQLKEESERWLLQAQDEFGDADALRKMKRYYIALFHFQQATEKALKAYLYFKVGSAEVFHTNSIDELGRMAQEIDPGFKKVSSAKSLDRYYIPTRYPNGLPGGVPSRFFDDPKEAEQAMLLAKGVIELVGKKLRNVK